MGLVALVLLMVGRAAGNVVTGLQCAGEGNTRPRLPPGQLRFRLRSLSLFAFVRVNSSLLRERMAVRVVYDLHPNRRHIALRVLRF